MSTETEVKTVKILVTGGAGFIGSHLMNSLLTKEYDLYCVGIDNFNNYYDPQLKKDRCEEFGLEMRNCDLNDFEKLDMLFQDYEPDIVVHLAARAGVRNSMGNEHLYHKDNIEGTQNLINACKLHQVEKVIYASTSSVYSGTKTLPWTEDNVQPHQRNPYAYTKYVNECQFKMSGLHNIGLRFFTVYGPWGRPDMALFDFSTSVVKDKPIKAYNYGLMKRDFTYIDDIVEGIKLVIFNQDIESGEIFNIGNGKQVELMKFIDRIGIELNREPKVNLVPPHPADVLETWSNTSKLQKLGYQPMVDIEEGVAHFMEWYKDYMEVN